jgi:hypothetical protein
LRELAGRVTGSALDELLAAVDNLFDLPNTPVPGALDAIRRPSPPATPRSLPRSAPQLEPPALGDVSQSFAGRMGTIEE